ncbi:MAG: dockerin type I domain-containing protein [Dehalococcoidia bacterium]
MSNNAGVADNPVFEGQTITSDADIRARYSDEGQLRRNWSALVVGKPANPYNVSWYVHRWDGFAGHGVLQDFDSPDPAYGAGAIMHGDSVIHDRADGRNDSINAMWVFGDFWHNYISFCNGVQYFQYLGYPTSEQYQFDYLGYHWWQQQFQNGVIFKNTSDNLVNLRDRNGQRFGPNCDAPAPPPPTPTRTNTPTLVPTATNTFTPTPTATFTPTATPSAIDTDGDGYTDAQEIAIGKNPLVYCKIMRADVNGDGTVNVLDQSAVVAYYNQNVPPAPSRIDQNADAQINILDLALLASVYNTSVMACP